MEQFNEKCRIITQNLLQALPNMSPLFVLSLRREYFMMINSNNDDSIMDKFCHQTIIHKFFQRMHEDKSRSILFHTHISKAGGTTFFDGVQEMARKYNVFSNESDIEIVIRKELWNGIPTWIFKGIAQKLRPFKSCPDIYSFHMNKLSKVPVRVEWEAPLTKNKICPQYYNSIIMRNPLHHRLSILSFINKWKMKRVAVYRNINDTHLKLCAQAEQMKGFLFELFGKNDGNLQRMKENRFVLENRSLEENPDSEYNYVEYVNPEIKNYALGYVRWPLGDYMRLNTSFLVGWLTQTYIRWIGFDPIHPKAYINGMIANYDDIMDNSQKLLQNSKRILLQYDYVLPLEKHSREWSTDGKYWNYVTNQIANKVLNIEGEINFEWGKSRMQNNRKVHKISTNNLLNVWNETGELELLMQHNTLDFELFKFSKQVARTDLQFIKEMNTYQSAGYAV